MANKKISQLDAASAVNSDAVFPLSQLVSNTETTQKGTVQQVGSYIAGTQTYSSLNTTSKTVIGAINELEAGGGGGGTSNYNDLTNKPQVNSVTLSGDKTSSDLKVIWKGTQAQYDAIVTKDPETIYFITDTNGPSCTATDVTYDPSSSALSSTTVQTALNELSDEKADKTDLTSIHITGSTNNTGSTITSGTFFYLNSSLVRATDDIANGATLTSGTNYDSVTAGGLNNLVSDLSNKMDKANPTGTGSLSLNRLSGSYTGENSVAEGYNCTASSYQSHAEGNTTISSGNSAHAEGRNSEAAGLFSHAEGDGTTANGTSSHSEGAGTTAQTNYSHAEGYNTTASGTAAHAEGESTTADHPHAHAEGLSCTASGDRSHAEGYNCTASGATAHAENSTNVASGNQSHAEGYGNTANHLCQHVFGQYNVADTSTAAANARGNYVEIVGNGTNTNSRSNARTLDWSGNEVLAGGLKINGTEDVLPGVLSGTVVRLTSWSNNTSANIGITTNTGKQFVITINSNGAISGSVINPS